MEDLRAFTSGDLAALDLWYVARGLKPVARVLCSDEKRAREALESMGCAVTFSSFGVRAHVDKTRGCSDKGKKVNRGEGMPFLYAARSEKEAQRAKEAEERDDHRRLGDLLGYPLCCQGFYEEARKQVEKTTHDPTPLIAEASEGFTHPFENNVCLRGFDVSLLSHFPCSFGCRASTDLARLRLRLLEKVLPGQARRFQHLLRSTVIYAVGIGVYALRQQKAGYEVLLVSKENSFSSLLRSERHITIASKKEFAVGKAKIGDAQTFVAVFV